MKTIQVEITGTTPLLHHRMSDEAVLALLGTKAKVKKEKVVKTPREIAEEAVYRRDDGVCYIPGGYLLGAFMGASANYKRADSSKKSLKSLAGAAFRVTEEVIVLTDLSGSPIKEFEVDIRKGTNGMKGAVCVCRPRFDQWKCKFVIELAEDLISAETANKIMTDAGRQVGIGSFRPCKSGWFGQFVVTSWQELRDDDTK